MQHVFIIGSKGIPGNYGGYETFVDKLTEYHKKNNKIKYHVACKGANNTEHEYHNARCFSVAVPNIGPAQAIYYDIKALYDCCRYIKNNKIEAPIIYILTCRIGPFAAYFYKTIHRLGGKLYVNPDGHEWMRRKWSAPVRKYWKISERMMMKSSDLVICDSINIEKYIQSTYKKYNLNTIYISYGAEFRKSELRDDDSNLLQWYKEKELIAYNYYLVVGRFVPENNFEIIIREFLASNSKKDLAIVTTANVDLFDKLEKTLHFKKDKRIKFVGSLYDQELLKKIRENAYGYIHGHEVGGTNPSLLESLGSTNLNLLLDVGFNREVGNDSAIYWNKKQGNLASEIEKADTMSANTLGELGTKAKRRISENYSWEHIAYFYEKVFINQLYK